jgi:hypothetical protein
MAVTTDRTAQQNRMRQLELPEWTHEELLDYIHRGQFCGSFLEAILSNDLKQAVNRCMQHEMEFIPRFIIFLTNHAPMGCWGSPENYDQWRKIGGLAGLLARPDHMLQ